MVVAVIEVAGAGIGPSTPAVEVAGPAARSATAAVEATTAVGGLVGPQDGEAEAEHSAVGGVRFAGTPSDPDEIHVAMEGPPVGSMLAGSLAGVVMRLVTDIALH